MNTTLDSPRDDGLYPPIGDYALIGDCRGAGLVARDGSIDWLCLPRYDSPSVFAALLDAERGGRFRVRPLGPFGGDRRYFPDTNVLETTFRCPGGTVVLRDLMPVSSEENKRATLTPDHEVLRELEGLAGQVDVEVVYEPRPEYAGACPALVQRGPFGLWCEAGGAVLILRSDVPLAIAADGRSARGVVRIRAGERAYLSFLYTEEAPAVLPPLGQAARHRIALSEYWWRGWADRCRYQGPYRDAVVRSALALKLLTHAPSGAVVAAATTSLPEKIGGVRNWDYRYCWLRDASLTFRALYALGYREEAEAFLGWILHATRLTWPELKVVYDVYGRARLPEREVPQLAGYRSSRPVRVGNSAHGQLQLDIYGEVVDAAARFAARRHGHFDNDTTRLLNDLGGTVCRRWREPDDGIWEGRAGRFQHTHSKVLCWAALDRLVRMHEEGHIRVPIEQFRSTRAAIRTEVEARGYNQTMGTYTRTLDGDEVDASLLVLPLYGYVDAAHPRMRSTYDRIREKLACGPLFQRYEAKSDDGLPPGEGAFGICSFWAVECLARRGDVAEATRAFEQLLSCANDVGLFAEEIDPATGAALGNFPQGFTHVGLVNAALTLAACQGHTHRATITQVPTLEEVVGR